MSPDPPPNPSAPPASQRIVVMGVAGCGKSTVGRLLADRRGHFMPPTLLESQLATLEHPADALRIDIAPPPAEIVDEILRRLP